MRQTKEFDRVGQLGQQPARQLDWVDIGACGLILIVGVLEVLLYQRSPDFLLDDVCYLERGLSLFRHGFYGFNGRPETNEPPGLPVVLAILSWARMGTHAAFLRAMAVFETLGFVATYAVLRRQVPKAVAAAICLLLISSPIYFLFATQLVYPSFPTMFTIMSAFLVANRLDSATRTTAKIAWGALLTALIAASLMLRSDAMAFLGAMVAVIGVTFFRDRRLAVARLKNLVVPLVIGLMILGYWLHRKPAPSEWPLPGYPQPYLAQLAVRDGNHPELGMATVGDVGIRIIDNGLAHSSLLVQLVYKHWVNTNWTSAPILLPILLMLLGWGYSVWLTGGELHDWYFAAYEFVYLLWPWSVTMEPRFFLPVAPLACMYIWRGGKAIGFLAKHRPRTLGAVWLPAGMFLTVCAWLWERGGQSALTRVGLPDWFGQSALTHGGLQDKASAGIWLLSAATAGWLAWMGSPPSLWPAARCFSQWNSRPMARPWISTSRLLQVLAVSAAGVLVASGLAMQLQIGRDNLNFVRDNSIPRPDVAAATWIHSHTDSNSIVMARSVSIVYYYADRKTVWFPPSSDPRLLMDGIGRHRIDYVIVAERKVSYFLPADDDCFAPLLAAYPDAFRLVFRGPGLRIFQVVRNPAPAPRLAAMAQSGGSPLSEAR